MRRQVLQIGILFLALTPAGLTAQWQPPQCELSTGHYLVNSALSYLRNAARTRFGDQRQRDLRDAERVLLEALGQGREGDPAVWYFLGRYYVTQNDLPGADSSFDRALAMAPQCEMDIGVHRRAMWVPILNRGVDALQNEDNEGAKRDFRLANTIYDQEPTSYYYLAQIFATEENADSSIAYYRQAIRIARTGPTAESEQTQNALRNSTFNVARLYHRAEAYDSAAAWYRLYRELEPDDAQALIGLAEVAAAGGRTDEALVLYDSVLARAPDMSAIDLFATGVALFRSDRFERAAQAFVAGLEKNPHHRDALFNLANTYLSMGDEPDVPAAQKQALGEQMHPVLERLLAVDPMSVPVWRLLAASFQLRGLQDSTLAVLERIEAMPFDVTVSQFEDMPGGEWEVRGLLSNAGDAAVQVPAITFEFVTAEGEVVATHVVDPQSLEALAPFAFRVQGETIAAWRYRVGE
jgi:tetratricopeptide (TPR) repeat protein